MSRTNRPAPAVPQPKTHEGAPASRISAQQQLSRVVMSSLLFERQFYIDGMESAKLVAEAAEAVPVSFLSEIAREARTLHNLRHIPLLLTAILCRRASGTSLPAQTIATVIQRADELAEFLAVYAVVNGVTPDKIKSKLSDQARKGLALAFHKFDEYQFGKYNRDNAIKLRDVMFLAHPKPVGEKQAALFKAIAEDTLKTPDTWEVALSTGQDKAATWARLIFENKLGYMAVLRNLRNMQEAGVDESLINGAIVARRGGAHRLLPFRYIAAAMAAPQFEPALDKAFQAALQEMQKFRGKTALLVDGSGSMHRVPVSERSKIDRVTAAACLASMWPGEARVFAFADSVVEVPRRQGMAGIDAIRTAIGGGTQLAKAISMVNKFMPQYDRIVVITDEQSHDGIAMPLPGSHAYLINVGAYQNGVGYGKNWVHVDGWSEQSLRFISAFEADPWGGDIEKQTGANDDPDADHDDHAQV